MGEGVAAEVSVIVALVAGALVVGLASERMRIPYSVALVVVALAVTPLATFQPLGSFQSTLLIVFLPALVFEAALALDAAALRRMWRPIVVLAIPGVLVTALIIALADSRIAGLAFPTAFLLGAILSATDPVAVIALFRRLTVPLDLQTLVESEALANDGTAVVLYVLGLQFVTSAHAEALQAIGLGIYAIAAAVAIGIVFAFVGVRLLAGTEAGNYAVGTLVLAYGSFLLADRIGASGIFACATAGIAFRTYKRQAPSEEMLAKLSVFWEALAFLANSLVFLLMGFVVDLPAIVAHPWPIVVTLAAVIVARAVLAYGLLPLCGIISRRWQHVVSWAGLRGGLAIALALSLPAGMPQRETILGATFAVVLVTLVVQGLTIEPLLRRLKL
jgi:CPA1 family monovalent cation:H+ antiporter